MIIYDAEMSNNMIPSNSPPAEVQIVSMEPPALTLVIVPYPLEHCSDWQLSACRSLGGNCRAAVFTSRSLIASASVVLSHDYTTRNHLTALCLDKPGGTVSEETLTHSHPS